MAREQRVALNKPAVVETPRGEIAGGGVVEAGYVPQAYSKLSDGQRIAQALQVTTKALTTLAESKNKETRALEETRAIAKGRAFADAELAKIQKELQDIPLYSTGPDGVRVNEKRKYLEKKFQEYANSLAERGGTMHKGYYAGALDKMGKGLEALAGQADATLLKQYTEDGVREQSASLLTDVLEGTKSPQDMMTELYQSGYFDLRSDATDQYFAVVSGYIKEQAQKDPLFNYSAEITRLMKVKSKDGVVDFTTDPKYGKVIDTLEEDIRVIRANQYTTSKNAIAQGKAESDRGLTQFYVNNDPEGAKAFLLQNKDYYTAKEYTDALALIRDMPTQVFATDGEADYGVYINMQQLVSEGKFNLATLQQNKRFLTKTQYDAIVKSSLDYSSAIKTEMVATAKSTFDKLLTPGQANASGVSIFDSIANQQVAALKKNLYTQYMIEKRNEFISANGWAALTAEQVRMWDAEAMKYLNSSQQMLSDSEGKVIPLEKITGGPVTKPVVTDKKVSDKIEPTLKYDVFIAKRDKFIEKAKTAGVNYADFVKEIATATGASESDVRAAIPEAVFNGETP